MDCRPVVSIDNQKEAMVVETQRGEDIVIKVVSVQAVKKDIEPQVMKKSAEKGCQETEELEEGEEIEEGEMSCVVESSVLSENPTKSASATIVANTNGVKKVQEMSCVGKSSTVTEKPKRGRGARARARKAEAKQDEEMTRRAVVKRSVSTEKHQKIASAEIFGSTKMSGPVQKTSQENDNEKKTKSRFVRTRLEDHEHEHLHAEVSKMKERPLLELVAEIPGMSLRDLAALSVRMEFLNRERTGVSAALAKSDPNFFSPDAFMNELKQPASGLWFKWLRGAPLPPLIQSTTNTPVKSEEGRKKVAVEGLRYLYKDKTLTDRDLSAFCLAYLHYIPLVEAATKYVYNCKNKESQETKNISKQIAGRLNVIQFEARRNSRLIHAVLEVVHRGKRVDSGTTTDSAEQPSSTLVSAKDGNKMQVEPQVPSPCATHQQAVMNREVLKNVPKTPSSDTLQVTAAQGQPPAPRRTLAMQQELDIFRVRKMAAIAASQPARTESSPVIAAVIEKLVTTVSSASLDRPSNSIPQSKDALVITNESGTVTSKTVPNCSPVAKEVTRTNLALDPTQQEKKNDLMDIAGTDDSSDGTTGQDNDRKRKFVETLETAPHLYEVLETAPHLFEALLSIEKYSFSTLITRIPEMHFDDLTALCLQINHQMDHAVKDAGNIFDEVVSKKQCSFLTPEAFTQELRFPESDRWARWLKDPSPPPRSVFEAPQWKTKHTIKKGHLEGLRYLYKDDTLTEANLLAFCTHLPHLIPLVSAAGRYTTGRRQMVQGSTFTPEEVYRNKELKNVAKLLNARMFTLRGHIKHNNRIVQDTLARLNVVVKKTAV